MFARRVTDPLERRFGNSAKGFRGAGLKLGGEPLDVGDGSFVVSVLPRVPLEFVFWEGDDEFPPKIQLLFDAAIDHYLSLEDIVVLGQLTTGRLIHQSTHF